MIQNVKKGPVKRGEIYWADLGVTIGSETKKMRPTVILSNNIQNLAGHRYIVAPITSVVKNIYPFDMKIDIQGTSSKIMFNQLRTIDRRRLGAKLSKLSPEEVNQAERIIKVVLHLS